MIIGVLGAIASQAKGIIVSDSFNRADNDSTLGNTDTGQTWLYSSASAFGIQTNRACRVADGACYINSGKSDCVIKCDMVTGFNISQNNLFAGLTFRFVDINNHLRIRADSLYWLLEKRVSGVTTSLAQFAVSDGVTLSVVLNGDNVKVYENNVIKAEVTVSDFKTETSHGLYANNVLAANARWDNFIVEAL